MQVVKCMLFQYALDSICEHQVIKNETNDVYQLLFQSDNDIFSAKLYVTNSSGWPVFYTPKLNTYDLYIENSEHTDSFFGKFRSFLFENHNQVVSLAKLLINNPSVFFDVVNQLIDNFIEENQVTNNDYPIKLFDYHSLTNGLKLDFIHIDGSKILFKPISIIKISDIG